MAGKTYMTEARLRGLVFLCNKHGGCLALKSDGSKHVILNGGVPATPPLKPAYVALYLNGFLANVDASTRRKRRS